MKKKNIILIEDDAILSKVVNEELEDADFKISTAFSGREGLDMVRSELPDLILLDLILPEIHGFDVLAELKKDPKTKNIPVIILTMLGSDDDIKKGISLGAQDYIVKSQHAVGEIIEKVKSFLQ
jgi:DNA-binding response OmpR family regulator